MQLEFLMAALLRDAKEHVNKHPKEYEAYVEKAKTERVTISRDELISTFAKVTADLVDDPTVTVLLGLIIANTVKILFDKEEK